jgi:mRNA interferase MazF
VPRAAAQDPRKYRFFAVVSRQVLIDSRFSSVVCAPVYLTHEGLSTQVPVGVDEGLKHESAIFCGELVSLRKSTLTDFAGMLSPEKLRLLDRALRVALELHDD